MSIQTVAQRAKLEERREPHWHMLAKGRHVGFRNTEHGGHWIARAYDASTRQRAYKALTEVARLPGSEQFSAASKAARAWFEHLDQGGTTDGCTVKQACAKYVQHLRDEGREDAADDAQGRFARMIDPDPIAPVQLQKLAARNVREWRAGLMKTHAAPPKRGENYRGNDPLPEKRKRAPSSHNRDMTALRAALNLAKSNGYVVTDLAWSEPLKPIENANGRRTLYLTLDQRRALLKELPKDLAAFARGLCLLPLRPGALAKHKVGQDFDPRAGTLTMQSDKGRAPRTIPLPPDALALLKAQAKSKLPGAPLFMRADGRPWDKDMWKGPIADAVEAAKLPKGATLYTLRHSTITDLVTSGCDLFTVAALSGTSVAMIEKHYGHLRQDHAREALKVLSL